jgi:hypothetical protein
MEPTMANPFKVFPEQHWVKLRRICLAQAAVCLSTLASMAVLLSRVVPTMMGTLN